MQQIRHQNPAVILAHSIQLQRNKIYSIGSSTQNCLAKRNLSRSAFVWYANVLMKKPAKILVGMLTVLITAAAIAGNVLLEQKFDPTWFLPPETYLAKWFEMNRKYFPFGGDRVTIWCHGLDYLNELEKLDALAKKLAGQKDIIDNVDSWTTHFIDYLQKVNFDPAVNRNETIFREKMTRC